MSEQLCGKVRRVFFANPDRPASAGVLVLDDGKEARFVGRVLAREGEILELVGEWKTDAKWGRQFEVASGTAKMDESPDALAKMLATKREFKGLGQVRARRVVEAALELSPDNMAKALREQPDEVARRANVHVDIVRNAGDVWAKEAAHYDALATLVSQGWTNGQAATILHYVGADAAALVASDPYGLIKRIPRFGFRTVDAVALKLGVPPTDPKRLQAGVAYCLDQIADNGDTWTTREALIDRAIQELRPDTLQAEDLIVRALDELIAVGLVYTDVNPGGADVVADALIAAQEFEVFGRLIRGLGDASLDELAVDGPRARKVIEMLNDGQRAAVLGFSARTVSVISGAGGVGKTFTMLAICEVAEENGLRVGLCAPTGKAARRLSHSTRRQASTIHRLLEPKFDERTGRFRFLRDAGNPVELDLVVVDEVSMCDVKIMRSLLSALPQGCRLLLVGDHNQIPPVGAGAVLRDLLSARTRFPDAIHVLTQIVRQAGELARNTTAILDGIVPPPSAGSVVWQIHRTERGDEHGAAAMAAAIVEMVVTSPQPLAPFGRVLDLDWDVQVLAPMRKGPLGVFALNVHLQRLRARLSGSPDPEPTEENKPPKPLAGDRVIWTENDYELELFNGTQAIVVGFGKDGGMHLFTEDGREVTVPSGKRNRVEVAYAMTFHKAQGAEWPFVLMVASSAHWIMHDRNLLYTGASRASESLMILGDMTGLRHFAQERKSETRQTFGMFLVHGWEPRMRLLPSVVAELE